MSVHAGDDPTPRAGEGGPYRKTPTQLATDPAFTGTYASRKATVARRLHTALDRTRGLLPTVNAAPPTIAYGTSRTLSTRLHQPIYPQVRNLGGVATYDGSVAKVFGNAGAGASTVGLDFWLTGDQVEFSWFSAQTNAESIWVWVDGQPCTAAPSAANGGVVPATSAGTQYYGKLTFGSVARRRVTIYAGLINAWGSLGTLITGAITPAQRRPRIAVVGDSYAEMNLGGVNPIGSYAANIGFALGAEVLQRGVGGTGYTTASGFGNAARVANVAAGSPDAIIIVGSVNDAATGLQAAATACYDAYAAACPNVPIFVYGPQPSDSTNTIGSGRQAANAAVKAAATAHSAVWSFTDLIGDADALPAAYNSGTTYNTGDKVTYLGSVWQLNNGVSTLAGTAPGASGRWQLLTWGLTGTGNVGAAASDGSRDVLLYSDNVHPTAAGSEFLGVEIASDFMQQLATFAAA